MEKQLYNNRILGIVALFTEYLIEHLQTMSYMKSAGKDSWKSDANDSFDNLKKLALRFSGDDFLGLYYFSIVLISFTVIAYLILQKHIHTLNAKANSKATPFIWVIEHIIFGLGFVPILSQFRIPQFCDTHQKIKDYTDVKCYKDEGLSLMVVGQIYIGLAIYIVAVILPVLKSERRGLELVLGDEKYFPGLYKVLIVGVIFLFAPLKLPWVGMMFTGFLALYLLIFECYQDVFVGALKLGFLLGEFWVFLSCEELKNSQSTGSNMLIGWPLFILVGFGIFYLKRKFLPRKVKSINTFK